MVRLTILASLWYAAAGFHAVLPLANRLRAAPPAIVMVDAAADGAAEAATEAEEGPKRREAYFCNDQGCWIAEQVFCDETGCWIEEPLPPITLPDGRIFTGESGVESHQSINKRKKIPTGLFAPAVLGAKTVLGEKNLNSLRGKVIAEHSKVIASFVDTSESPFGQIVLKQLFEAADTDKSGALDREEVKAALNALGFKFIKDKQLDQIFARGDMDGNEVIDFEEFVKEAPKTLRSSLIKQAKENGHDLGFLA